MIIPVASAPSLSAYLDPALEAQLIYDRDLPGHIRAHLARELRHTLASCAAYIPTQLVLKQLHDPHPGRVHGEFWQGSLLFADLSGFTSLSSTLSSLGKQGSEEVSTVVNRLFNDLVAEVLIHQGALLKFGGDALTAFFDSATLGPLHAAAATRTALAMQERMQAFSQLKTRKGVFRLQLRVGVHSGRVFAAEVGDESHVELVVTGSEVNRVATAQEIAAPGEVVISDYTAELLEGALLLPRKAGFQSIVSLPNVTLPSPPPDPTALDGPDDVVTLELLAQQVAALRPYLVRSLPSRFLDPSASERGEFRPVTVLFANFHDFSAILEKLGEEADTAAKVLNAYFQRAQQVVHRYDGIVNKVDMYTHGDKLMALFGAPTAHEDDPLRAVRCALELETALEEANREIADILPSSPTWLAAAEHEAQMTIFEGDITPHADHFSQSIGINTGTVFAGRVGGARRYEYTVMGSAVNLSARLMAAGSDGAILLSPDTRVVVENNIALVEDPPLRLKGLPEPVTPARALYAFEMDVGQIHPLDTVTKAPLVGRDTLLTMLAEEGKKALRGKGRVVSLIGEAGIGKSRLFEELTRTLVMASLPMMGSDEEPLPSFHILSGDCQSYEQSIPYAVVRNPLRHLLGISARRDRDTASGGWQDKSPQRMVEERVYTFAPELIRFAPLLDIVLGITLADTPLTKGMSDELRHQRLQELVVRILLGAARNEALVLMIEDIQWADASSLELIDQISRQANDVPIFIMLNYRPEPVIEEPWTALSTTTRVVLDELPRDQSADLLEKLLQAPPPPEMLDLLDRTEGNPFFIEELVRALVASKALEKTEDGAWRFTRPIDQFVIPTSIEGLIYSRLDRLDEPLYDLVQIASVIGRRFHRSILENIYTKPELLEEALLRLIDAEMITVEEKDLNISYFFRHGLLRDVAYEGILYARRRELHRRVAQEIEDKRITTYDERLPLLANHYLLAEEWMLAFLYHYEAAIDAQERYANREALSLLAGALKIVPHLTDVVWWVEEGEPGKQEDTSYSEINAHVCPFWPVELHVIELHERSGYILTLLGESNDAEHAYMQALTLVQQAMEQEPTWSLSPSKREYVRCTLSQTSVRLHRHLATLYEHRAAYETSLDWLYRGLEQVDSSSERELARCYLLGARLFYIQGELDESLTWARIALHNAEKLDNRADLAQALLRMGNLWAERGEFTESITALRQACDYLQELNYFAGLNSALSDLGMTYADMGQWNEAINCYGKSLQISENIGDTLALARTTNNLALVMLARGDLDQASNLYQQSCDLYRHVGSEQGVALTTSNRGEVLLLQGNSSEALQLFEESITIMKRINARLDLSEVLRLAAEASLELGNYDQAKVYADDAVAIARELGMALKEVIAQRVLGQIALCNGDLETATAYFEKSKAGCEHLDNRPELGRVLFWQAKLAQKRGCEEEIIPFLDQAEQIFRTFDAKYDLERLCSYKLSLSSSSSSSSL